MLTKFKLLRLRKGLTQFEISRKVGEREGFISKIETGKLTPGPELAFKLGKILGADPEKLFDEYRP